MIILLLISLTIGILAFGISYFVINRSRKTHLATSKIISIAEMRNGGSLYPKSLMDSHSN